MNGLTTTLSLATLVLTGCVGGPVLTQLPLDHPANPDAPAAPAPEPSQTLAVLDPVAAESLPLGANTHVAPGAGDAKPPPGQQPSTQSATPSSEPQYACPMHPEVTSAQAGQRCPKCGMRLVEQDAK